MLDDYFVRIYNYYFIGYYVIKMVYFDVFLILL